MTPPNDLWANVWALALAAGVLNLVLAGLLWLWAVFASVLTIRGAVVLWKWLNIWEARAHAVARAEKIQGNTWNGMLLAAYLAAVAVPVGALMVLAAQPAGWILVLVAAAVLVGAVVAVVAG